MLSSSETHLVRRRCSVHRSQPILEVLLHLIERAEFLLRGIEGREVVAELGADIAGAKIVFLELLGVEHFCERRALLFVERRNFFLIRGQKRPADEIGVDVIAQQVEIAHELPHRIGLVRWQLTEAPLLIKTLHRIGRFAVPAEQIAEHLFLIAVELPLGCLDLGIGVFPFPIGPVFRVRIECLEPRGKIPLELALEDGPDDVRRETRFAQARNQRRQFAGLQARPDGGVECRNGAGPAGRGGATDLADLAGSGTRPASGEPQHERQRGIDREGEDEQGPEEFFHDRIISSVAEVGAGRGRLGFRRGRRKPRHHARCSRPSAHFGHTPCPRSGRGCR